jgi:hypothetical protein
VSCPFLFPAAGSLTLRFFTARIHIHIIGFPSLESSKKIRGEAAARYVHAGACACVCDMPESTVYNMRTRVIHSTRLETDDGAFQSEREREMILNALCCCATLLHACRL